MDEPRREWAVTVASGNARKALARLSYNANVFARKLTPDSCKPTSRRDGGQTGRVGCIMAAQDRGTEFLRAREIR
jgi:hypothetical protein